MAGLPEQPLKSEHLEIDLQYILDAMKNCGWAKEKEDRARLSAEKQCELVRLLLSRSLLRLCPSREGPRSCHIDLLLSRRVLCTFFIPLALLCRTVVSFVFRICRPTCVPICSLLTVVGSLFDSYKQQQSCLRWHKTWSKKKRLTFGGMLFWSLFGRYWVNTWKNVFSAIIICDVQLWRRT